MRVEPYLGTPTGAEPLPPEDMVLKASFSGSGQEYFRIWIVNLLLTVATLGVYSAWAKTRRLQYFYRNTHLAGASFDFLGNPKAILRGRIVAVLMLAVYHYAFGFSARAGLYTVLALVAALPFMMRSALRFRLSNTSYRGLPFGFCGGVKSAYRCYAPALAVLLVPGAVAALDGGKDASVLSVVFLAWPFLHGAMKRYQHRHLMYGDQQADFALTKSELARPYWSVVWRSVCAIVALVLVGIGIVKVCGTHLRDLGMSATFTLLAALAVLLYLGFLMNGLYVAMSMDNLAWSATSLAGVHPNSAMQSVSYLRLQVANALLTIVSLGLYRPFAVVRTWRYRLEHTSVWAPQGLEQATLQASRPAAAAAGDGAADFLGVDLSW